MKKLLIILGIVVLVIIVALITAPMLFKPQIVKMVKEKANQSINANVDFKDVGISLLKNFPNAGISIDDLVIIGRGPFDGDTLAYLQKFEASVSLGKLLFDRRAEILSLSLIKPRVYIRVLENGKANYMIFPEVDAVEAPADTAAAAMDLAVKRYKISDGYVVYINDSTGMAAQVSGLNHEGKGDFKKEIFTLATNTEIDDIDFKIKGASYLTDARLRMKADLEVDTNQKRFAFKENQIKLNELILNFDGWIRMADNETELDLTFGAPQTEFKSLLSMVPAIYKEDFGDLKAEGQLKLDGIIRGTFSQAQFPMVDIKLFVEKGMFQHPQVPAPVRNVDVNLQITNPGVTMNETVIDLRRFHLEIDEQPLDAQLLVRNPVKDPYIDGLLKGTVNLGQVGEFLPLGDSIKLTGTVRSDLTFRGNISSVQERKYENMTANGSIAFADINYELPALPMPIQISAANISFSTQQARLERFDMQFGKSNLSANGALTNMIGYVLGGQVLAGRLSVTSQFLDLNPFLQDESGAIAAVELPDRVEFTMSGEFDQIIVANFNLTDVKGQLILKDRKLFLSNLNGGFLDGQIVSNGTYSFTKPGDPHVDFDLKLTDLSIPQLFKTVSTAQAFAPMAEYMEGTVSGNVRLNSDLGDSLKPIWQTLSSNGSLRIPEARVEGFGPLIKLGEALKLERLKNPGFSNFAPSYGIDNGVFNLNPTTLRLSDYEAVLSGSNSLDKSIDYVMKLNIPASDVKANINSALSSLIKQDVNLLTDETVVIDARLTGTFDSPQIQTSLAQIARGAGEQLKKEAQAEAERKKQELEAQAKKKLEEQKTALEDSLKKEIEQRSKGKGDDIKDRIKGLFGK
jgi:uncharacterized protein involved in outer membrane biogenesis